MLQRITPLALWLVSALLVTALGLRFAMRALGVRDDIPFPGLVYSLTAPLVQPFYRYFPAPERFDYHTTEAASLLAAGIALALTLTIYVVGLFARSISAKRDE